MVGQPYPGSVAAKKPNTTNVIVGVVIAVVVLALVGGGIWWMVSRSSGTSPSQQPQPAQGSVTVNMNGHGPVRYEVTGDAELSQDVGQFYDAEPGMIFVSVPTTVTYLGSDDSFYFDIDDTALVTTDGTAHEPDFTAEIFAEYPDEDNPFWIAVLKPGESVSGLLIYQVESGSTDGAVLRVGVTTNNPVTISIGL